MIKVRKMLQDSWIYLGLVKILVFEPIYVSSHELMTKFTLFRPSHPPKLFAFLTDFCTRKVWNLFQPRSGATIRQMGF